MKKTVLGACCLAFGAGLAGCCCLCGDGDYPETVDEGFVSLFNGKDLSGWYGSKKYGVETIEVKLNNGTVVKQPVIACFPDREVEKDCGNLLTEKDFKGKTIDVKGFVDFYSGSYQIKVFSANDIVVH